MAQVDSLGRLPGKGMVRQLVAAGANAPRALLDHAVSSLGPAANDWARSLPADDPAGTEVAIDALIETHVKLARVQGLALGAVLTGLELTPFLGPAGELPWGAAALGFAADVVSLALLQARLLLYVAAAYGHDAADADARLGELGMFFGVAEPVAEPVPGAGEGAVHSPLVAVKALARMAGLKFTRKRLLELLPIVNPPVFFASNGAAVQALGAKARTYYRSLPKGAGDS